MLEQRISACTLTAEQKSALLQSLSKMANHAHAAIDEACTVDEDEEGKTPEMRLEARIAGEHKRLEHVMKRLRTCIDSMELSLRLQDNIPVPHDALQALQALQVTTSEAAMSLMRLDAYRRALDDSK